MLRTTILLAGLALCQPLTILGQQYVLGTASDPCTGGSIMQVYQSTSSIRWDNSGFSCKFPLPQEGMYIVQFSMLEPCYQPGACAGGQITKAGQRMQNFIVNDQPAFNNVDPYAMGATDQAAKSRFMLVYAQDSLNVAVKTVTRSAVLAAVSIIPLGLQLALRRQQCQGHDVSTAGVERDCTGIELLTLTAGAQSYRFSAVEIDGNNPLAKLPACTPDVGTAPCLRDSVLSDPSAAQDPIAEMRPSMSAVEFTNLSDTSAWEWLCYPHAAGCYISNSR